MKLKVVIVDDRNKILLEIPQEMLVELLEHYTKLYNINEAIGEIVSLLKKKTSAL